MSISEGSSSTWIFLVEDIPIVCIGAMGCSLQQL